MRRERQYLQDILAAADALAQFTRAQTSASFAGDLLLRSGVVHQLMVIIVHNYFGVDWEEVWRTAIEDVPLLRGRIEAILLTEFTD
jgi:uncharacterized protein with HEPN domain